MSFTSPRCTVEVPAQLPVKKLQTWLSEFGEQHRKHYEQNQVKSTLARSGLPTSGPSLRYRIQTIEKRLSASSSTASTGSFMPTRSNYSSSSSSSSSEESLPTHYLGAALDESPSPDEVQAAQANRADNLLDQPAAFRDLAVNQLMPVITKSQDVHRTNPDDSTVLLSWHPNARLRFVPSSWVGGSDTTAPSTTATEDDDWENNSFATGHNTDPGSRWQSSSGGSLAGAVRRPPSFQSRDDLEMNQSNTSWGRRSMRWKMSRAAERPVQMVISEPKHSAQGSQGGNDASSVMSPAMEPSTAPTILRTTTDPRYVTSAHPYGQGTMSSPKGSREGIYRFRVPGAAAPKESTWSEHSCSPSILPKAINFQLNEVFFEETEMLNRQTALNAPYGLGRNQSSMDLMLDDSSATAESEAEEQDERELHVLGVVQAFGGAAKKSAIQRRKDELELKWAENRPPLHVKKVKWHVSNSGGYKKKVFLDIKR